MNLLRFVSALSLFSASAAAQVAFPFERTDYAGGSNPVSAAAGDLDGDGFPDVVYASEGSGEVFVRANQGDGSFGAATVAATIAGVNGVALGHIDGDGLLDLVAMSDAQDKLFIFPGLGTGGFGAASEVAVSGALLYLAVVDLTGDGFDEFLLTSGAGVSDGLLRVGLNNGGVIDTVFPYETGEPASNVAVGDLNGDGRLDLVTSAPSFGIGDIFLGLPGLVWGPPLPVPTSFGGGPEWVALLELDGDGVLDLVTSENDAFDTELVAWKGLGDGSLSAFSIWESISLTTPGLQATGDFNGDGQDDLAARWGGEDVQAYGGDALGRLWAQTLADTGADVRALIVADFDQDGNDDVLTANAGPDRLSVLLARPQSVSAYGSSLTTSYLGPQNQHMALQLGDALAGSLYWVLGSASGTAPGLPLGAFVLPLNFDGYTQFTIDFPGTLIEHSLGFLNAAGAGNATLTIPGGGLSPSLAGVVLNHSFLVVDPGTLAIEHISAPLALSIL